MTSLLLIAPRGHAGTLTMLAQRFADTPGVEVIEDRRMRERRITKRMFDHGKRSGRQRRGAEQPFRGSFVLVEPSR